VYSTHIDSAQHFGRHWHDTYGFGFIERGAQGWASGRGYVRGYAGDVITTNPGEVHDGRPLGEVSRRWRILYVDVTVMASICARGGSQAAIAHPVIHDRELLAALRRLFRRIERWNARESVRDVEALACEESLVETCASLMARHGSAPAALEVASPDMRRVRDRLCDSVVAPPTLADLATMTGLSRYQLLRHFERAYGLPPHAWLVRQRVERARVLIRAGMALSQAAAATGFADQSHMTRAFVRQHGFTPGAWRAAVLQ